MTLERYLVDMDSYISEKQKMKTVSPDYHIEPASGYRGSDKRQNVHDVQILWKAVQEITQHLADVPSRFCVFLSARSRTSTEKATRIHSGDPECSRRSTELVPTEGKKQKYVKCAEMC